MLGQLSQSFPFSMSPLSPPTAEANPRVFSPLLQDRRAACTGGGLEARDSPARTQSQDHGHADTQMLPAQMGTAIATPKRYSRAPGHRFHLPCLSSGQRVMAGCSPSHAEGTEATSEPGISYLRAPRGRRKSEHVRGSEACVNKARTSQASST